MRNVSLLACLSTVTLLAACGMPNDGYYDANGNYVGRPNSTTEAQRIHSPSPGQSTYRGDSYAYDQRVVGYEQRGYYDYNGYYVSGDSLHVPENMFPPRGMCRVWFPERALPNQPRVEPCDGIRSRVPSGAYVIYGG